jgi:phospholipase/carboxylesterase
MKFVHEPGDPTVVCLHGTGGNEVEFLEFVKSLVTGTGYLSARGQEPENGMNRWFRRFAEGVFDEDNLRVRAHEFAAFVLSEAPTARRIAVGFSNGANMAAATWILHPEAFDAAVLIAPMVPFQNQSLPELSGRQILLICGEQDPMVPRLNAHTLASQLVTTGADVQVHWHPGGHSPDLTSLHVARSFLARIKQDLRPS